MDQRVAPTPPEPDASEKLIRFPKLASIIEKQRARPAWQIAAALSLLVLIVLAVLWWMLGTRSAMTYTTVPAAEGAVTRAVTATGTVNPELTIIVGSYVSGVIQELYCDYNTVVKKSQICAKIDPRPYQTVVDQNKANLAVAQAQLQKDKASLVYAQVSFERAAKLVQTNSVSKDAYDNAKSAYDQAQAQVEFDEATIQQRQAALDAAQVNLDYTDIISPVDGVVVSRSVTMGQTVAASFQTPTLFLIATDLTRMEVDTNVSESDIGGIKEGDTSTFTVDAYPKRIFQATVTQVRRSPQTVQNVVTYDVVLGFSNADLALMPGMTAASRIVVDERANVLRVPNQALRYVPSGAGKNAAGQTRVWVLKKGKPVAVPVTTGLEDDSYTEIASGDLKPGDPVIVAEQAAKSGAAAPRLRF
jgi:HlyD family secretion protein